MKKKIFLIIEVENQINVKIKILNDKGNEVEKNSYRKTASEEESKKEKIKIEEIEKIEQ